MDNFQATDVGAALWRMESQVRRASTRYYSEYESKERETSPMPYARCSECGQTMHVEKVSNDVMMMWHGTHCGSSQTYFADKDIFETSDQSQEEETSLDPARTMTAGRLAVC